MVNTVETMDSMTIGITIEDSETIAVEKFLDRNPNVMEDIFLRKATPILINKWLQKNGYCALSDISCVKQPEDNASPLSPGDNDVFFTQLVRNNSKKHLRRDFAKSKYKNVFRTYEPVSISVQNTDERRNSLKEMKIFRSLPPNSNNILSLLIQSKIRLPRIPSKDIDRKREEKHANQMEFFMDIVKDISNDLNIKSLSQKIAANVSVLADADYASVFVVEGKNTSKPSLVSKLFDVHSGTQIMPSSTPSNFIRVPWGKGIIGHVAAKGETVNIANANQVI